MLHNTHLRTKMRVEQIWKTSYGGTSYLAEMLHFVQHFVYFWNNILSIYKYWHIGTISQRNVKYSSVLEQDNKKVMLFLNLS